MPASNLRKEGDHMPKRYRKLRAAMVEFGIDRDYLAEKLGVSPNTIDCRFSGRYPWTDDEEYAVLDILNEPDEKKHVFFPRNRGVAS